MSLDITRLQAIVTGSKNTQWRYDTTDAHASVDTAGYFNSAYLFGAMRVGDIIDVVVWSSTAYTAVSTYGRHIVNANDGSSIDVSDVTAGTVTDTD